MGYRVGPVALWVHCLFFCANCLACSHSVRDRNLHTLNKEVADCEFFRAQAPCDFRPEYPQAFLHLKKRSALLIVWQRSYSGPGESGPKMLAFRPAVCLEETAWKSQPVS